MLWWPHRVHLLYCCPKLLCCHISQNGMANVHNTDRRSELACVKAKGTLCTPIMPTTTVGCTFLCVGLNAMVHKVLNLVEVHEEESGLV